MYYRKSIVPNVLLQREFRFKFLSSAQKKLQIGREEGAAKKTCHGRIATFFFLVLSSSSSEKSFPPLPPLLPDIFCHHRKVPNPSAQEKKTKSKRQCVIKVALYVCVGYCLPEWL